MIRTATLLTRRELADLISQSRGDTVTVRQIISNEKRWGLSLARRDLNARVVRYDRAVAQAELASRFIIHGPL